MHIEPVRNESLLHVMSQVMWLQQTPREHGVLQSRVRDTALYDGFVHDQKNLCQTSSWAAEVPRICTAEVLHIIISIIEGLLMSPAFV